MFQTTNQYILPYITIYGTTKLLIIYLYIYINIFGYGSKAWYLP